MKRKYYLERIFIGGKNFFYFDKILLILEADVPVYNVKWFIDRKRELSKCPKCRQPFTILRLMAIFNQKIEKEILVWCCLTCSHKPAQKLKITFLKDGKFFDLFRVAEEEIKRREHRGRKNFSPN